jgi:hypothetical protein
LVITPLDRKKFTLQELQNCVGGSIERIPLKPPFHRLMAYANEESKLLGLHFNQRATLLANIWPDDWVAGNLIVIGGIKREPAKTRGIRRDERDV